MILSDAHIQDLPRRATDTHEATDKEKSDLLAWVADNPYFKTRVGQGDFITPQGKIFRFTVEGRAGESVFVGTGSSKTREEAALIAAAEATERFTARKIFAEGSAQAIHSVNVTDGKIGVVEADPPRDLPSRGFHSSNGWAVHFSLKAAIESATIEALERHILLYDFLNSQWQGFKFHSDLPMEHGRIRYLSSVSSFGGFRAGVAIAECDRFSGNAFGYLCYRDEITNYSVNWFSAFLEAYYQVDDFLKSPEEEPKTWIGRYQQHFLRGRRLKIEENYLTANHVPSVNASIVAVDLQKALNLSFPFFGAFVFGGDLIPLFFSQKLNEAEQFTARRSLQRWGINGPLPEFHPIL